MSPTVCPQCRRAHPLHRCDDARPMSAAAHDLLDRARDDEGVDAEAIADALRVTGDLPAWRWGRTEVSA